MSLIKMEYASIASSEAVNNNFQYLEDKIESVSQAMSANVTTINNNATLLSTTVANNKSQIEKSISELQEDVNSFDERIYIKESYNSGQNWYRLYSDGWIEQGGCIKFSGSNITKTVSLFKVMLNEDYSVIASGIKASISGEKDTGAVGAVPISNSQIKITGGRDAAGGGIYWRVCGFTA